MGNQNQKELKDSGNKKPDKKIQSGSVSATIWSNEHEKDGKKFTYQTVNIERRYKDKNDEWQSTSSFRVADLPKVSMVSMRAFELLTTKEE